MRVHPSLFHGKENWPKGNRIRNEKAHLLLQEGVLFVLGKAVRSEECVVRSGGSGASYLEAPHIIRYVNLSLSR